MPELPEVETIARGLAHTVVGKTIGSVKIHLPRMAVAPPGVRFATALRGERIEGVGRRAKYVVIDLASGRKLVTSLRMTGRLVVQRAGERDYPGTHVVLHYTDGTRLAFADVRTFGRMRLVEPGEPWDARAGRGAPLPSLYTGGLCGYALWADDADQDTTARSTPYRRHRKYLCVRGAVGSRDPSQQAR